MIDFENSKFFKLSPVDNKTFAASVSPMLVPEERIFKSFQTILDGVVFTNKRIITINVQELTKKKLITPLCPTAGFRHILLKLRVLLIGTAS